MFKNALVSVTDKTGLAEFLKPLVAEGLRVVSTGGTAKYLKDNGIKVIDIQEQTGYPEVMDGRVRTLHPRVYMPILARGWMSDDFDLLKKENLEPFDLIVTNLYQFSNYVGKNLPVRELIEYIDIGGPSLLRAAAKNFDRMVVLCDPKDYSNALAAQSNIIMRQQLAAKVFRHVSDYDNLIANELSIETSSADGVNAIKDSISIQGILKQPLRYGENPHQVAGWYRSTTEAEGWQQSEIIQGKELSYNNLLDLEAAVATLRQFGNTDNAAGGAATCVVVKHNNACGLASANEISTAVKKALQSDPVSSFGGIIALNEELDLSSAQALAELFLECIVAPSFSADALAVFSKKKNLRILKWKDLMKPSTALECRSISGGFLAQQHDPQITWKDSWTVLDQDSRHKFESYKTDLLFAFRVVASLKSNAIVLVENQQTVGLGMGQVNRVDSVQHACERMIKTFKKCEALVLASDAFFPFPDSIDAAGSAGVKWIIQPGGSKNDVAVLARARELGIGMVITGERHFRH